MSENKIALVTGASRGIGRSVAIQLASVGMQVIAISRTVQDLESLYDQIVTAGYKPPILMPFNLCSASLEDYDDLRRAIKDKFGKIDVLVHCAGILGALTPIEHYDIKTWYQVMQVNLNSAFILTQTCMQLLKQSSQGQVVFTINDIANNPKANWGAYAVANTGIQTLAELIQQECATLTKIKVHTITPSKTNTALRSAAYPSEDKSTLLDPDEVAKNYLRLLEQPILEASA